MTDNHELLIEPIEYGTLIPAKHVQATQNIPEVQSIVQKLKHPI